MLSGIVFGLDGTLSNPAQRQHLAQAGVWDEYREAADRDEPFPDTARMLSDLTGTVVTAVVTSRDESQRAETEAWLRRHRMFPDAVLMRPVGDRRRKADVKVALLLEWCRFSPTSPIGSEWADVLGLFNFAVDADPKVAEVYRSLGLPCWVTR